MGNHELHIGDFNGDCHDDLLCHNSNSGHIWIAEADRRGIFNGTSWYVQSIE